MTVARKSLNVGFQWVWPYLVSSGHLEKVVKERKGRKGSFNRRLDSALGRKGSGAHSAEDVDNTQGLVLDCRVWHNQKC